MKNILTSALSAAAVGAFLAATPAFAQDTVTGAPAGTAPATVEGYGSSLPGAPGYGYNGVPAYGYAPEPAYGYNYAPAYGYGWGPFAPVGALAAGIGALGADVVGATGNAVGATLGAPAYAVQPHAVCRIHHDRYGRRFCGP